jgi:Arc/MetJ-type ribon-helix-helix transcriptional regulator
MYTQLELLAERNRITINLDPYIRRMDKLCGEGKDFRSRSSLIRYLVERGLDHIEETKK